MKLKEFMDLYDNWNGVTTINDDNLDTIVYGTASDVTYGFCMFAKDGYTYSKLWNMEVVSFGFYDNELCIRVK